MPAIEGEGKGAMVGRKWDCLSNSSRARAKDEEEDLNLERFVCLVSIKVPRASLRLASPRRAARLAEEIVSEINSSKLILPLSFRLLVTKRRGS